MHGFKARAGKGFRQDEVGRTSLLFESCMDAFVVRDQNTNTMEEGDRSENDLSQYVDHASTPHPDRQNREVPGVLRRWAKEQAVPFLP